MANQQIEPWSVELYLNSVVFIRAWCMDPAETPDTSLEGSSDFQKHYSEGNVSILACATELSELPFLCALL